MNKSYIYGDEGNDTLYNFGATDSLTVSGKFSTVKSGSDIKVKVITLGEGKITLQSAASLPKVNIDGVYKDPTILTVTNSTSCDPRRMILSAAITERINAVMARAMIYSSAQAARI